MISNEMKSAGRINQWLWRHVERHQRRPRWQRVLVNALWTFVAMAAVFVWLSVWDCPIC
jgi:hypothetical protein